MKVHPERDRILAYTGFPPRENVHAIEPSQQDAKNVKARHGSWEASCNIIIAGEGSLESFWEKKETSL